MKKIFFLLFIMISLYSCVKDYFDFDKLSNNINWNPSVAAPVIHSKLTVRDLILDYDSQHLFVEDSTHFLYLIYKNKVFSLPAAQYVQIPDQQFSIQFSANEYTAQGFPVNTPVTVNKNITQTLQLELPGDIFDTIVFKQGTFSISVNSSFQHTGILIVTFPTITKNGTPYSKTIYMNDINYSGTVSFNDLQDYKYTSPVTNQLACQITLTLNNTNNNPVYATDQANVQLLFSNMKYKIIYGNFGNRLIPIQEDTVKVDIFNNTLNGHLFFINPKIKLHIYNSFGVPMGASFPEFKIYSSSDHTYYPYNIPATYNPCIVTAPQTIGNYEITHILLDTNNFPQIRNIIFNNPRYFYLKTITMMNPPFTSQYNFIEDTSRLAVDLEVELPLWGYSSEWILQDTSKFDFSEYLKDSTVDLNNIEYVTFNIYALNAMPTEAKVQIYFTDSLYNKIDSLFSPSTTQIINSGVINANGKVIQPTQKVTQVTYTGQRINNLRDAKNILIKGVLITTNNGNRIVKFYSDNYLDVKLGIKVQAKINTQTDLQ